MSVKIVAMESLRALNRRVVACRLCPRLVEYRENLPPRKAFADQTYWRRPVPGFGDPNAKIVIVGLAPAAHGGERTGRVFTGDESARFLYRSLHEAGLSNHPTSESSDDRLELWDCYITAAVKCAPPENKPTPGEFRNCSRYLHTELALLENCRATVALGGLAFGSVVRWTESRGADTEGMVFGHGSAYELPGLPKVYGCYHPSPRNTYTGTLTRQMLTQLFRRVITESSRHSGGGH